MSKSAVDEVKELGEGEVEPPLGEVEVEELGKRALAAIAVKRKDWAHDKIEAEWMRVIAEWEQAAAAATIAECFRDGADREGLISIKGDEVKAAELAAVVQRKALEALEADAELRVLDELRKKHKELLADDDMGGLAGYWTTFWPKPLKHCAASRKPPKRLASSQQGLLLRSRAYRNAEKGLAIGVAFCAKMRVVQARGRPWSGMGVSEFGLSSKGW